MDQRRRNVLWFLLSFVPSFGLYLAIHFGGTRDTYYVLTEFAVAVLAVPVLLLAWGVARGLNRPLAQGFIWALVAIFMFLFSFGGCGQLTIG